MRLFGKMELGLFFAVLALVAVLPGPARADYAEAEKAYAMGRMLVEMGDYSRGVFELKKAASILPQPAYLEALIQALRGAGKDDRALIWAEHYRAMVPAEKRDSSLEAWIDLTMERFNSAKTRLLVRVVPEDALLQFTTGGGEVLTAEEEVPGSGVQIWLPPGEVTVRASKEGFDSQQKKLELEAGKPETLELNLGPEKGKGTLSVECNVEGATVRIGGKDVGRTPFSQALDSGRYLVTIWASDHADWTGFVVVIPEKTALVQAELKKVQGAVPRSAERLEIDDGGGLSMSFWGWMLTGVGVGCLGGGGYFFLQGQDKETQAGKLDPNAKNFKTTYDWYTSQANTNYMYAGIIGGAGVLAVAGGIMMIIFDDDEGGDDKSGFELLSVNPVLQGDTLLFEAGFGF